MTTEKGLEKSHPTETFAGDEEEIRQDENFTF